MKKIFVHWKTYSKGYKFIFQECFPIPTFARSQRTLNRSSTIWFEKFGRISIDWDDHVHSIIILESSGRSLNQFLIERGCLSCDVKARLIKMQKCNFVIRFFQGCLFLFKPHKDGLVAHLYCLSHFFLSPCKSLDFLVL